MKKLFSCILLFPAASCIYAQPYDITGHVNRLSGQPVPEVITYLGGDVEANGLTDNNGAYSFSNLPANSNLLVLPFKDINPTECVSVRDLLVIGKHILGVALLENPYAMIAADANRSGGISTSDLIAIQRVVLGRDAGFPNNTSWRFVNAGYQFPNPANPWFEDFPEELQISNLQSDRVADFIGIKTGDPTDCVGDAPDAPFLTLAASSMDAEPGDLISVDITAQGFNDVSGLQFSMEWDASVLEFEQVSGSVLPGLNPQAYYPNGNQLSVCWFSNTLSGLTYPDNTAIMALEFRIVGQAGDNTTITFTEVPTPFEVVDGDCFPYELNTNDGSVSVIAPSPFLAKIYGDTAHNTPTRIKAFPNHDGLYVAGTRLQGGVRFATFSKFNRMTGELEWDFQLQEGSIFHDFEFIPQTRECLLAGATEPFQANGVPQDNESILVKVDDSGQMVFGRKYQQTGREHFNRIIRHPDPRNPDFPYYITGTVNPPANPPFYPPPPSATDRVFVLNINADGMVQWANYYDYNGTMSPDDEFHRGLFPVGVFDGGVPGNGDIVITGNDSPVNDGIVVKINGETGAVVGAFRFPSGYDIYDGIELPSSQIALAGADFANSRAFVSLFNNDFSSVWALRFGEVELFREIGMDIQGRLYAAGPTNFGPAADNFNIIHRITPSFIPEVDYARFMPGEAIRFENPRLMVSFHFDQIFYADGRLQDAGGFGNWDMLTGSFDLEFSSSCRMEADSAASNFDMQGSPIDVRAFSHILPPPTLTGGLPLNYECGDFCNSAFCQIAFTWSRLGGCGRARFTPQPEGNVPVASYLWDVNCDGIPESTSSSPILGFGPCGGTFPVCLTVEYEDGRICSYEETITIPGDNIPPLITALQDITVTGSPDGSGNCTAEASISIPIVSENCTRVALINDYTGQADASGIYPQGTTTVTFTATDECGNTSSFQMDVTVVCRNCGEAVISCFPDFVNGNPNAGVHPTSPALGIVDIRNPGAYNPGDYAEGLSGQNIYHPAHWNFTSMGLAFGLAIDNRNNIYAASSTIYGCSFNAPGGAQSAFGPSGNSRIYMIDPFDNISTLIEQGSFVPGGTAIPSDGAGYGNICYDPAHNQLFATNFHDGLIYRINLGSNTVADFFDPFQGPNPVSDNNPDFVALGQRPWGIAYNKLDGKLYYSKWNEDRGRVNASEKNEIWCVQIDQATGGFAGPDAMVIEVPDHIDSKFPNNSNYQNYSNPVSDIAFSEEGIMLIAERSMQFDCGDATQTASNWFDWYSHQARILEYQFNGMEWVLTPGHGTTPFTDYDADLKYKAGSNHPSKGATAAGGVDYGYSGFDPALGGPSECDKMMWASGDYIRCQAGPPSCFGQIYGIQGVPTVPGGNSCDGITIDFDGIPGCDNKVQQGDVEIFKCLNCPPADTCLVSFSWQPLACNTAQFTAQAPGSILVSAYSWDVNCDGVPESAEAGPELGLGQCGTGVPVCLTVEYIDGRICTYEETVALPAENIPPSIGCSGTYAYSTDPGACYYTGDLGLSITDNCDPSPEYFSYELSGATTGSGMGFPPQVNEGLTFVTVTAIDECGNESLSCAFQVTVADEEAPQIQCPGTAVAQVPGCSEGTAVTYPDASATDNCELAGITYDISSGSFFSCGQTAVTATATDIFGNSSQCSFTVQVNGCRDCAQICGGAIECGAASGQYSFNICVDNLTALPDNSAIVSVSSPDGGITLLDNALPGISGYIEVAPPLPAEITFLLSFEFPCPFGVISCVDSIKLTTPCCEEITVADQAVCAQAEMISIPLLGDLPYLSGVDYIRWYVAPAPCESFVLAYQASGIAGLPFFPSLYSGYDSACVYAELVFLPGYPCESLVSNTAAIYLCELAAGGLNNGNGPFCSDALPSVYEPITFSSGEPPACAYTIQWYLDSEPVDGATSDVYTPGGLSFTGSPADCYSEHLVSAQVTNLCGTINYGAFIRIYNSEAPPGELFLDPSEEMPFCPGEDAVIRYEPNCAGPDPYAWQWCVRTGNTGYQEIEGAGTANNIWNTNPLEEDTWYSVKKKNGACPEDTISLMIGVRGELSVTGFSATEDDACDPAQVILQMGFAPLPAPGCDVNVYWYKDGLLLGTTSPQASPAAFAFSGPVLAGNYYAVIEDICCGATEGTPAVAVGPPMEVGMIAPCFRCNDEIVVLEGYVENPPEGAACTFQWLKDGAPIPSATGEILPLDEANATFTFQASCGDCVKEISYFLLQCGGPVNTRVFPKPGLAIQAIPNPTSGELALRVAGALQAGARYRLIDQWGRSLLSGELAPGREENRLSLERLPAGLYFIQVFEGERLVWVEKVARQE